MNNTLKKALGQQIVAMEQMAAAIGAHLPMMAPQLLAITENLRSAIDGLYHEEDMRTLEGRSELQTLKMRLGLADKPGPNLLESYPEEDRLDYQDIRALIKEHLSHRLSCDYSTIGYFSLPESVVETLPSLPARHQDYHQGLFLHRRLRETIVVVLIDASHLAMGADKHFLMLHLHSEFKRYDRIVTYYAHDDEWVEHSRFNVLGRKSVQTRFLNVLKEHGYQPPQDWSLDALLARLDDIANSERTVVENTGEEVIATSNIVIENVAGVTFSAIFSGQWYLTITAPGAEGWQRQTLLNWQDLTPAQKNRIIDRLNAYQG